MDAVGRDEWIGGRDGAEDELYFAMRMDVKDWCNQIDSNSPWLLNLSQE